MLGGSLGEDAWPQASQARTRVGRVSAKTNLPNFTNQPPTRPNARSARFPLSLSLLGITGRLCRGGKRAAFQGNIFFIASRQKLSYMRTRVPIFRRGLH
jgi:hypothetical protein